MSRRGWIAALLALVVVGTLAAFWWLQGPASTRLLTRLFTRQDGTWAEMQARKTWRVGMDPSFPPFEALDDSGVAAGYDVDLARALAEDWGLQVEIVAIGYDSLADALRAGRIDSVVSAFPYDPRATRDLWFSVPYFDAGLRLVTRASAVPLANSIAITSTAITSTAITSTAITSTAITSTVITSTASLSNSVVAVEWGSMGDMIGRRLQRQGSSLQTQPYATPDEAVAALQNDPTVDALFIDQVSLRQAQGRGARIVAVGPPLESNPYVIAAPLRAFDLQERIAASLQRIVDDGTLAEIETRWFGPLPEGIAP